MAILEDYARNKTSNLVLERNKYIDEAIRASIEQGEFAAVLPKPEDEAEFVRIALALKVLGYKIQVDKLGNKYRIDWSE